MDVQDLVAGIEDELRSVATPERAAGEKQYLKSDLEFLGATMPEISKATKRVHRAHPDLSRTNVVALVRRLWRPGIFELRMAATKVLKLYHHRLTAKEVPLIERLLRESRTWA
ncbi:MAG: DNA alkylation repair protein, partial [Acidimicrobiia bacterium]